MKMFVWERLKYATTSYHSEGGVMVIAESLEAAMKLAEADGVKFGGEYDSKPLEYELVGEHEEKCIVFPDAGCC